jgi:hypothetical protein
MLRTMLRAMLRTGRAVTFLCLAFLCLVCVPAIFAQAPDKTADEAVTKKTDASAANAASTLPPSAAKPQHNQHKKKAKAPKPVVLPQMPSGPLRQLPMDQIPATAAKVTYQGGMLTISAQNSPMGEILREVRRLTGATIDIPPHAAAENERVITHLGPGSPRDVLVSLLNGSSFNYVMLGSNTDPTVVASIILTSKTPGEGESQTVASSPYPNNPPPGIVMPPHPVPAQQTFGPQGQPQPQGPEADDNTPEDNGNAEENAAPEEPQPGQPGQAEINGNGNGNAQDQQQDPNQPNAGPKTPEQILEMLRRQQPPGGSNNPGQQPQPPQ